MRFMILVKATADSEAGVMPKEELFAEMATYHEALAKAGVLRDGSGLQPSARVGSIEVRPVRPIREAVAHAATAPTSE